MIMYDFEYVPKEEWEPIRDELFEIIHRLQKEVRDDFTFQYHFEARSKLPPILGVCVAAFCFAFFQT